MHGEIVRIMDRLQFITGGLSSSFQGHTPIRTNWKLQSAEMWVVNCGQRLPEDKTRGAIRLWLCYSCMITS
jgi:hypothetical protein